MQITTSPNGVKAILELDEQEKKWWRSKIKEVKDRHVLPAKDLINNHFDSIRSKQNYMENVKNTSSFIKNIRDETWDIYVETELLFYKQVIKELLQERPFPEQILETILNDDVLSKLRNNHDKASITSEISEIFGDFTGRIFPYFYELSKSVTQGNRSRAGKAFEAIIHNIMDAYNYNYEDQASVGKKTFEAKGMGKMVDGLVPGLNAFNNNRSKCLILTMKTTLRERWQEVVEELNRTNIPSIHLLTLDDDINENLLKIMKNHNITLVAYKGIKEKFPEHTNIISYESLFNIEIPHTIDWWEKFS